FSDGSDGFSSRDAAAPRTCWAGDDVDLGAPLGHRYAWRGLFRRDFADGVVLVNQPGAPTVSVDLGATYTGINGLPYRSGSLAARSGTVLRPVDPGSRPRRCGRARQLRRPRAHRPRR